MVHLDKRGLPGASGVESCMCVCVCTCDLMVHLDRRGLPGASGVECCMYVCVCVYVCEVLVHLIKIRAQLTHTHKRLHTFPMQDPPEPTDKWVSLDLPDFPEPKESADRQEIPDPRDLPGPSARTGKPARMVCRA